MNSLQSFLNDHSLHAGIAYMSLYLAPAILWGKAKCKSVLPEWDVIIISVVNAKGDALAEEPRGVLVVGMALEADGKDED